MEIQDLLNEIRRSGKNQSKADQSDKVDEPTLVKFLYGVGKIKKEEHDFIVDIQVCTSDLIAKPTTPMWKLAFKMYSISTTIQPNTAHICAISCPHRSRWAPRTRSWERTTHA